MLVLALTGTDPDRLAEEKAREMTIDLGFAFFSLPGIAGPVAIVDVPGHEMFLRNMVAGATGIDAAMLVIACDEGVMPQTVEHLDVLRCLRISEGVIVLTKCDKSSDRIAAVTQEARELARGTFLEKARAIPVSSVTGEGLPALKEELARIAARVQARSAEGIFRLPIDRVFTLKGVGTVVTGTVISGSLKAGEIVACLPQNSALRVRALQVHNQPADEVFAGQRAAINLADASKEDLERGNVLATPGSLAPTLMADVRLELSLRGEKKPLAQRARVRIHHGTSELMARVVLLDRDSLQAGESALAQLRFESPLVAAAGDPFVVRSYSPMFVIGGGSVVDPHPPKRRKAAGAEDVAKRESSPVADVILDALDRAGARGVEFARLRIHCGIGDDALRSALAELKQDALAADGRRDVWFSVGALREMQSAITARLARLHAEEPLRPFAALNQVSAGAAPAPESRECFRLALEGLRARGEVVSAGERLRLASHQPQWVGRFAAAREKFLAQSRESGLAVPTVAEWAARVGLAEPDCRRALDALAEAGELILLAPGIFVHPESFGGACDRVKEFLAKNGRMNIAQARDLLGASRKYLLPFLEEMDRRRVTARQGDFRVPGDRTLS